ncbi:hypothetical protein HHK36_022804 [Tetracentron sinense]|uniref:F-box domain-containing protein n=1 Tax=Tetracentron sinense TaxID=13715 RepID=A0A835D973_TETSI|nr:hypothetical protein HHK36_022804 [Tetracentron sinense]
MGCCGDEDDEIDIFKQLISNYQSSSTETLTLENKRNPSQTLDFLRDRSSSTSTDENADHILISPMNSNFSALICVDILRNIFERLPVPDLARTACVCRLWNSVASDREIHARAFKSPWKLKDVIGNPISGSFWRDNSLRRFAISHRLVRGDTVASLAVKYSVQIEDNVNCFFINCAPDRAFELFPVMDIKRLNNMMSEHGIYSRERLLIPVSKPELLVNGTCYIEFDTCAKREVAVMYLEGGPDGKLSCMLNRMSTNGGKKRVIESLKRSMQVDDGTVEYYLSISNGDLRAAISEFSKDLRWERQAT